MSETGRNEEQQNDRDVERNEEALSDLAPTSEVSINMVRFPPPSYSRSNSDSWTFLLTGSALSIGGVAAGTYALRNFQHTTGWAVIFSSFTLGGVYLIATSLRRLCLHNLFNNPFYPRTGESRDLEALRYRQLLDQRLGPRVELPSSWTTSETGSFPPSPAVSNVSSDLLTVERTDYRPQSTDLSFRQKQEDRTKKYQKFIKKEWTSAPEMLQRQRSNASKDENDKEDEQDEVANDEESVKDEDEKEKKV